MATKRVPATVTTTVGDAINTAFCILEELAGEMREAYDNTPESLQGSGVGEARGEAADALESISEPDHGEYAETEITFQLMPLPKKASRADRRSEAVEYAAHAVSALEERIDELNGIDSEQRTEKQTDELESLESLLEETQTMIDEAEQVTFPGMFG